MSLIHTCETNKDNPFDYLTQLLRHAEELKQNPTEWMSSNYRETLARLARPAGQHSKIGGKTVAARALRQGF